MKTASFGQVLIDLHQVGRLVAPNRQERGDDLSPAKGVDGLTS